MRNYSNAPDLRQVGGGRVRAERLDRGKSRVSRAAAGCIRNNRHHRPAAGGRFAAEEGENGVRFRD